jgi:hypothetical protein
MNNRALAAFAFASALALTVTPGHALSFQFSFTNVSGNVSGTVTGLVEGLTANATSSATDVIVQGYPAGLPGLPTAPFTLPGPAANFNTFTVANNSITSAFFDEFVTNGHFCLSLASTPDCSGGCVSCRRWLYWGVARTRSGELYSGRRPRPHRRCRTSRPNLGERWPSRLVATAAKDRLSIKRNLYTSFAAVSGRRTIAIYEYTP